MFGSTANRLALRGSDIDVLVINDKVRFLYDEIAKLMIESPIFDEVDDIRDAEVPIINAVHKKTGIKIDMVINRMDGLQGLAIVTKFLVHFPELRYIYFVIKSFLKSK